MPLTLLNQDQNNTGQEFTGIPVGQLSSLKGLKDDADCSEITIPTSQGLRYYRVKISALSADGAQKLAVFQDHTRLKKLSGNYHKNKSILNSIVRVSPMGIGIVVNRIFKQVNTRLCDMLGYTQEELLGQSSRMIYPTQEEFDYVGNEKYKQINKMGTGVVETRFVCKDNSVIDVLLSSAPVNPDDLLAGVVFTAMDITEQKRSLKALKSSEERYRMITENMSDFILSIHVPENKKPYPSWIIGAVKTITGYSANEIRQMELGLLSIAHPDDFEGIYKIFQLSIDGKEQRLEYRIITKEGKVVWLRSYLNPVRDKKNNRITHVYAALQDITERKKLNRTLSIMRQTCYLCSMQSRK